VLLLVPALWGWGYPLIRESMGAIGPLGFLWLRFGIALIPLAALYGGTLPRATRSTWSHGVVTGIALFLAYAFLNAGLVHTTTPRAGFVIGLRVILVPLLAAGLFGLRVAGAVRVAAVVSLLGVALLFLTRDGSLDGAITGDLLVLASALFFALHVLLVGRFSTPETFAPLLVLQVAIATVLSAGGAWLLEARLLPDAAFVWTNALLAGLFATALAFWIQNGFQFRIDPSRAGVIYATEPLFATSFGFLYLGESLHGWQWGGALLICAGMVIALRR
jgi:drug/metabolite transporter (DMT)-like permease